MYENEEFDSPSGSVKTLDELLDLPHLNVLLRNILNLTHSGRRKTSSLAKDLSVKVRIYRGPAGQLRERARENFRPWGFIHSTWHDRIRFSKTLLLWTLSVCTAMSTGKKRKLDSNVVGEAAKKVKIVSPDGTSRAVPATQASGPADNTQPSQSSGHKDQSKPETLKSKHTIKKLVPPRPFPTVPTSVSATGPRSAHKEGKNYICLTRKTPLGAYMRRCKDVILKDGSVVLKAMPTTYLIKIVDSKLCT